MEGRIIKAISNQFTVECNNLTYVCHASSKIKNKGNILLAGDFVNFDDKQNYITEILPRKNSLIRPPISNIDNALIVTSVYIPDFSSNLLDKLICIIEFNSIKPIICFTKMDRINNIKRNEIKIYIDYYKKIGYSVFENTEINTIKKELANKITVFTGQTGSGKSTLLNRLDYRLNLKTGEVSEALGRGKHTTRHTELLKIDDMLIADTPGFSSAEFYNMKKEDIRDNFIEFNKYRHLCKYKDCMHDLEDECYIKQLVDKGVILKSRYLNYLNFIKKV